MEGTSQGNLSQDTINLVANMNNPESIPDKECSKAMATQEKEIKKLLLIHFQEALKNTEESKGKIEIYDVCFLLL